MDHEKITQHLDDLIRIESRYLKSYSEKKWYLSEMNSQDRIDTLNYIKELTRK